MNGDDQRQDCYNPQTSRKRSGKKRTIIIGTNILALNLFTRRNGNEVINNKKFEIIYCY